MVREPLDFDLADVWRQAAQPLAGPQVLVRLAVSELLLSAVPLAGLVAASGWKEEW